MKLYMKQKVFSWRDKFTVKDEQEQDRYFVEGELLSVGKKLHVRDTAQNEVAFIRQKVWAWMPRFIIEIGGREVCQIVRRFSLMKPKYELEGIGWHVEGDFWAHEYTVYDGNRLVMQLSKRWFSWGDSYELDIAEDKDELICVGIVLAVDAALAAANTGVAVSTSN